jgi:para-aminobenzoate synthetase
LEPGGEVCRKEGEEEDRRRGEALRLDPKERAENLMVSEMPYSIYFPSRPADPMLVFRHMETMVSAR